MLIVISYPTAVADEAAIINTLFDEGLEVLHLRKPDSSIDEIKELIARIKPEYYQQISLHQHHSIAKDFGIKRLHFTEEKRNEATNDMLIQLKRGSHILSTSIHNVEEYNTLSNHFDYAFFGPVFNSISKKGYNRTMSDDFEFPFGVKSTSVVAIGGIDSVNIKNAAQMKFDSVATLGAIWQKPDEAVDQFKMIQKAWKQTGR